MEFTFAEITVLYLAWYLWGAIYVGAQAIASRYMGIAPFEFSIGVGPRFLRFVIGDTTVSFGLIAFASAVHFPPQNELSGNNNDSPIRTLTSLPWASRAALHFMGPASCGVLGLTMLALVDSRIVIAVALIGLFNGLFNLIPVPPLAGFSIVVELLPFLRGRDLRDLPFAFWYVGTFVLLVGVAGFNVSLLFAYDSVHGLANELLAAFGIA